MTDRTGMPATGGQEPQTQDLVPKDDAIIGRAFRWSLAALAGAGIGIAIWAATRPEPLRPPTPVLPAEPIVTTRAVEPPEVTFTEITTGAGIDFVHENGATGDKLLPETMGGGCAFLDFDNDGDQDLLFVNSGFWSGPGPEPDSGRKQPTMALYRNDGHGHFAEVTAAVGLSVSFYGMGVAVGDYDNDGDEDLFLTAVGLNHLFLNEGGSFREVTTAAGVGGDPGEWSTSAGFFDYDNDGDLDLAVCNYVGSSRRIDFAVNYRLTGIGRAYGPPTDFQGRFLYLYRNNSDGTFTDVSASSGVEITNPDTGVPVSKALELAFMDVDDDGWIDMFIANDTVRNFLFRNRGDGSFEEVGTASGIAYNSMGTATGAMGIDTAYYRNDTVLGFVIGNFANEMTSLYVSQGAPWQFADQAIGEGLGAPSRRALSFGVFFFDYDLDGRLDLLQANGHLEQEINIVQSSQHYRQPAQLFHNSGPEGRLLFVEVPGGKTGDLARPIVGRGAAYADIDADGDLDIVLTQVGGPPMLLRNDQQLEHHWLRVKLVGTRSNRSGIGAWVEVTADGRMQRRQVMPTRSYLCQVELPLTFGLAGATRLDSLRVTWPRGPESREAQGPPQEVRVNQVDRTLIIVQPGVDEEMTMLAKDKRRQRVREILARNEIHSQEQLQDLLFAENIATTQATLSRDLRDLGAVRGPKGYVLPPSAPRSHPDSKGLKHALRGTASIQLGGTLVVLGTDPGHAQALALHIDRADLPQILGTVAGHDTLIVATQSAGQARELLRLFEKLAGRR